MEQKISSLAMSHAFARNVYATPQLADETQ